MGADIERIDPRPWRFVEDYFTEAEIACVHAVPVDLSPIVVTAIWSAKEAVLKALHLGLTVDTRHVSCTLDPETLDQEAGPLGYSWTRITVTCDPELFQDAGLAACEGAPELTGWWQLISNYVLTLVLISAPCPR